MTEKVVSHRRVVRGEDGNVREIENAVKAANIWNAGDLAELAQVAGSGIALLVGTDGKLRRATLGAVLAWMKANIPSAWDDAVAGGYTGTEAEFKALLAGIASQTWVTAKISAATTGMATQSWVTGKISEAVTSAMEGAY